MAELETSIVVEAPVSEVYDQWTQFTDQTPHRRIAWRSLKGTQIAG
jgi:uncharacterized membrane protein